MKVPFVDLAIQYKTVKDEVSQKLDELISKSDFILGEEVRKFEEEFAAYIGVRYGIGVASGTDAIYLSLLACGVGPGDEVITSANTFIATAVAISQIGARPVLVDAEPKTYNIDPKRISSKITKKTKAIIPVHLCGQPAAISRIMELGQKYKLWVIEDAAQAHGARVFPGKKAGSFGDLACFSFYPAKNLGAYGDGGMVVTDNPDLAEKVRLLRNYGQKVKNQHLIFGINSRLDNLQAAILRIKLRQLDKWNDLRRQNARIYEDFFNQAPRLNQDEVVLPNPAGAGSEGSQIPLQRDSDSGDHIYHLYVILAQDRDKLAGHLKAKDIATSLHYPFPIHMQECYKSLGYKKGDFPVAEDYASRTLSLPMYPELTPAQIKWVVDAVKEFYRQ